MSCFTGTVIKLSQRVLLIPRVRSNLCCAKVRDYGSKSPVKYIPKKTSLNPDSEVGSPPAKRLDRKANHTKQVVNIDHVDSSNNTCTGNTGTVFDDYHPFHDYRSSDCIELEAGDEMVDDLAFANVEPETNEVIHEIEGDFLSASDDEFFQEMDVITVGIEENHWEIQKIKSRQDVENMAIQLLASRAYTAQDLKKKLQGKKLSAEIVDAVIADFQSRGLINDFLYAEAFSRSRWSSSSWGPRRIKQALRKKGVSEGDTEKAIKLVFDNDEEEEPSGIAMSKHSIDQLYAQAFKQWQRSCGAPKETRKSRIVGWLQYRGFNWSVVSYILKKLESEYSH